MPKTYTRKERGEQNEMLYGRGAKMIPQRMLPTKADVDLSCEYQIKKGATEAEAVERTSEDIFRAYTSLTEIKVTYPFPYYFHIRIIHPLFRALKQLEAAATIGSGS